MKRLLKRPLTTLEKRVATSIITVMAFPLLGNSTSVSAAVTSVTLKPTVSVYHGNCPAKITFTGHITVNAPGRIRYVFTRSDGATDTITKQHIFLKAGSWPVSTTWTLGGSTLPYYKGWQAVKILGRPGFVSPHADFELNCDPALNSAKAAHGNTDWHIDTANEFLFGKDMQGNSTASNFAPASWTKTHIHTGLTNTARFYNDTSKIATGEDNNATNGIDKPMLFFYAGHGNATTWNTLGDNGHQTNVFLSDVENGGQLRYFWQCSCEVFAHGPNVCSGDSCDYSSPEDFDGSTDSASMRNVFERWGPALGDNLRMACGVSTLAYCHEGNVNNIWDNFNNKGYSVADSFIEGLGSDSVKPLCITKGGSDITKTPLYDETFTNAHNSSGNSHLHIIYASGTQTNPPVFKWNIDLLPLKVLRLRLVPPGDPVEFKRKLTIDGGVEQFRDPKFAGGLATVRRNQESGALHLRAAGHAADSKVDANTTSEASQRIALNFIRSVGWYSNDIGAVSVKKLLTASMPVKGQAKDIVRGEKATHITYVRRLPIGKQKAEVLGNGSRIDVIVSRGGEILAASRTWRNVEATKDEVAVKSFHDAQNEALRQLGRPDMYKLAEWRFGYKEESSNVTQREMQVVYQFDFIPKRQEQMIDFPPHKVEILATNQ